MLPTGIGYDRRHASSPHPHDDDRDGLVLAGNSIERTRPIGERGDRAVSNQRRRLNAQGSEGTTRQDAFPERDRELGLGLRNQSRLPQGARHLLADDLQLARAGAPAQSTSAVHDHDRRRPHSLRPSAIVESERDAAGDDSWLARVVLRVHESHRPADGADEVRRQRQRRVSRRRPVTAGLRLLG